VAQVFDLNELLHEDALPCSFAYLDIDELQMTVGDFFSRNYARDLVNFTPIDYPGSQHKRVLQAFLLRQPIPRFILANNDSSGALKILKGHAIIEAMEYVYRNYKSTDRALARRVLTSMITFTIVRRHSEAHKPFGRFGIDNETLYLNFLKFLDACNESR